MQRLSMKKYKNLLTVVIISLITSCGSADNKPAPVDDDGILINYYRPFMKNTRAVKLPENSTFKITDNLPIIDGATALYPLYAAFVQAVYPEGEYTQMLDMILMIIL